MDGAHMNVDIIPARGDNYIYLVTARDGSTAVIDPGVAQPVLDLLAERDAGLSLVLITHHHFDHTAGCRELREQTGCEVAGPIDKGTPALSRSALDGDRVPFGGTWFSVLGVPGHTRHHVAFRLASHGLLFTGDALFMAGCGRVIEGTANDMWRSLLKLRLLPDETLVYCGHDYTVENLEFAQHLEPDNTEVRDRLVEVRRRVREAQPTVPSTLRVEKLTNPFLRADTPELQRASGVAGGSPVDVFAELRRRKDRW